MKAVTTLSSSWESVGTIDLAAVREPALELVTGAATEPAIEPAIDRALAVYPPPIARRAAPSIRRLLAGRFDGRERASRSPLTGDGFPFELAFSTADHRRLRFTADPCGQEGQGLTYGAWVGARVDCDSAVFKVYLEVPDGARMPSACPPAPVLPDRLIVPRMIGCTPSTGAIESYFRVPSLEPEHVVGLLAPVGMAGRTRRLLQFIEHAYGYRLRGRLPGPSVGVSYAPQAQGHRVTLYFFARSLLGSDARIRTRFAQLAGERGWDAGVYLKVTEPMASRNTWKTHHGLVGITLDESTEELALSIGVRPIAP